MKDMTRTMQRIRQKLDEVQTYMVWSPKEGEEIIGVLSGKDTLIIRDGKKNKRIISWRVRTLDGQREVRLPSTTVLLKRLEELKAKVGQTVGIRYLGEGGSGRRRWKNYAVVIE